jgi:iturin family lipopeptide synthetase A
MSIEELVSKLDDLNIKVTLDEGNLNIAAPKGMLSPDIVRELKENKQAIIDYLGNNHGNIQPSGGLTKVPTQPYYDLSYAQRRLWIMDQMEEDLYAYNVIVGWVIDGEFDKDACEKTLEAMIRRHEILRTTYKEIDGEPRQIVHEFEDYNFKLIYNDISFEGGQDEIINDLVKKLSKLKFDLENGPLIRAVLVKQEPQKHILFYSVHHIISDGWSMGVLMNEVSILFDAYSKHLPITLPEVKFQYKDYVRWEREKLSGHNLRKYETYWLNKLKGDIPRIELPTYQPRPSVMTYNGLSLGYFLTENVLADLKELSKKNNSTLFATMIAILNVLFYKYTGNTDIVLGTDSAGRTHEDFEDVVGLFLNSLLLRSEFSPNDTFGSLLSGVKTTVAEAFEHQHYPFDMLVEKLVGKRDPSRVPLFDVLVGFKNYGQRFYSEHLNLDGISEELSVSNLQLEPSVSLVDINFTFTEIYNKLFFSITFNTDLYRREQFERMARHFKRLVKIVCAAPDLPVRSYSMLLEEEKQSLFEKYFSERLVREEKSLVRRFKDCVASNGESPAIVGDGYSLSYRDIDRKSDAVASHISRRGVGRGAVLPVIMSKGANYVIALLASLKTGSVIAPINPQWPAARIKAVLDDLDPTLLLIDNMFESMTDDLGVPRYIVDEETIGSLAWTPVDVDKDDAMYIIYTSGSTGLPKGVIVPYRGIDNRISWMDEYFGKDAAQSVLCSTDIVYDSSIWQILWPLVNGGKVVIPGEDQQFDVGALTDLVLSQSISTIDFVPSLFRSFVTALSKNRMDLPIRHIIVGGEEINVADTKIFMSLYPNITISNLYGPTEASIGCIYHTIRNIEGELIPIGKAIPNVLVLLLDEELQPVPFGVPGEIFLAGDCLAKGYVNNIEATWKAFMINQQVNGFGTMMYRTGDLARYLENGELVFMGRKDDQVKISGMRIELSEIKSHLSKHHQIETAEVLCVKNSSGSPELIAFYSSAGNLDPAQLRLFLAKTLPAAMVPHRFIHVDKVPVANSGKTDKKKLLDLLYDSVVDTGKTRTEPVTQLEREMSEIWTEILGIADPCVTTNFFEIGGNSLKAIQLIRAIKTKYEINIRIPAIFSHGTIRELVHFMEQEQLATSI